MPEDFTKCQQEGGKMSTRQLSDGRYMHMCKDKMGKWHAGEVKEMQGSKLRKVIEGK